MINITLVDELANFSISLELHKNAFTCQSNYTPFRIKECGVPPVTFEAVGQIKKFKNFWWFEYPGSSKKVFGSRTITIVIWPLLIFNWFSCNALKGNCSWNYWKSKKEAKVPDNRNYFKFMQLGKGQLLSECVEKTKLWSQMLQFRKQAAC